MTPHRPPVLSLVDYGSRQVIPTGAEIQEAVRPRVEAWRRAKESPKPGALESGAAVRRLPVTPVTGRPLPGPSLRWLTRRHRMLRAALLFGGLAVLITLLPPTWFVIAFYAALATVVSTGILIAFDFPHEVGRVIDGWRR